MKILIIRFSSIGDIVLTTAAVRVIRQQLSEAEVHYVTRSRYASLLKGNPYIDRVFTFKEKVKEVTGDLRKERYDLIVDLHKNLRSFWLKLHLRGRKLSFDKLNLRKWIYVRTGLNLMPQLHLVDRYMRCLAPLGVSNDGKGLDFFVSKEEEENALELASLQGKEYICIAIGSIHQTKQLPTDKLISFSREIRLPIVLLGGEEDRTKGELISRSVGTGIINCCGKLTIRQSACVVKHSEAIVSNDTGLMHIAAAFGKKIFSVWGNTVPEFGMYPYLSSGGGGKSFVFEIRGLLCRPCSKLGYEQCPKGHFNCMNMIDTDAIAALVNAETIDKWRGK